MSAEHLMELIKWITGAGAAVTPVVIWLNNRHKANIKKIEENSAGKIAIDALKTEVKEVREELKQMRSQQVKDNEAIEKLEDHYEGLIQRILDIYRMNSLKA